MPDRIVGLSELVNDKHLEIGAGRPRSVGLDRHALPILRVADVLEGRISGSFEVDTSVAAMNELEPKTSRPGDVVLTTKGTVGRVAIMPAEGPTFAYSPQLCYFRPATAGPLRPRYLYHWLQSNEFRGQTDALKAQTDMADFLSLSDVHSLRMRLPSLAEQDAVTDVLGTLDEKVAVNKAIASTCENLRATLLAAAICTGPSTIHRLSEVTSVLTRGITPTYTVEPNGVSVLNQKCVRNHFVNTTLGRSTDPSKVRPEKLLALNDALVNSTGAGTLGRAARWSRTDTATVDSHITIVRFDPAIVDPGTAGVALLAREFEIEAMAEGSTGQTELSRTMLGSLEIELPGRAQQEVLGRRIAELDGAEATQRDESRQLANLRDTLLPHLMSGRLRVKDAEKQVEAVV